MSNTQENDRTIFIFRLLIGHNQIGDTIISQNLVIGSDVMRLKMVTYQELGGPGKGPWDSWHEYTVGLQQSIIAYDS